MSKAKELLNVIEDSGDFVLQDPSLRRKSGIKVAELIKMLAAMDQKKMVQVSSDSEGNRFSPLFEVTEEGKTIVLWPRD